MLIYRIIYMYIYIDVNKHQFCLVVFKFCLHVHYSDDTQTIVSWPVVSNGSHKYHIHIFLYNSLNYMYQTRCIPIAQTSVTPNLNNVKQFTQAWNNLVCISIVPLAMSDSSWKFLENSLIRFPYFCFLFWIYSWWCDFIGGSSAQMEYRSNPGHESKIQCIPNRCLNFATKNIHIAKIVFKQQVERTWYRKIKYRAFGIGFKSHLDWDIFCAQTHPFVENEWYCLCTVSI